MFRWRVPCLWLLISSTIVLYDIFCRFYFDRHEDLEAGKLGNWELGVVSDIYCTVSVLYCRLPCGCLNGGTVPWQIILQYVPVVEYIGRMNIATYYGENGYREGETCGMTLLYYDIFVRMAIISRCPSRRASSSSS
jgi:hypothetical protein